MVAGLAVSLFGGSRVQIAGPTGAFLAMIGKDHCVDSFQAAAERSESLGKPAEAVRS